MHIVSSSCLLGHQLLVSPKLRADSILGHLQNNYDVNANLYSCDFFESLCDTQSCMLSMPSGRVFLGNSVRASGHSYRHIPKFGAFHVDLLQVPSEGTFCEHCLCISGVIKLDAQKLNCSFCAVTTFRKPPRLCFLTTFRNVNFCCKILLDTNCTF